MTKIVGKDYASCRVVKEFSLPNYKDEKSKAKKTLTHSNH